MGASSSVNNTAYIANEVTSLIQKQCAKITGSSVSKYEESGCNEESNVDTIHLQGDVEENIQPLPNHLYNKKINNMSSTSSASSSILPSLIKVASQSNMKDKLYPHSLHSVKSLRGLALLNHSKQENSYISLHDASSMNFSSLLSVNNINGHTNNLSLANLPVQVSFTKNKASANNSSNNSNTNSNNNITVANNNSNNNIISGSNINLQKQNGSFNNNLVNTNTINTSTNTNTNTNTNTVNNISVNVANNDHVTVFKKKLNLKINIQDDKDWIQVCAFLIYERLFVFVCVCVCMCVCVYVYVFS